MSCQGISVDDCTTLGSASSVNISNYIYEADTLPTPIDTEVLPLPLQTKLEECDGNTNCKLVAYDFNTDTGTKASNSPYVLQSQARDPDKTNMAVLAKVGEGVEVTSLGIPTDNLDTRYDPSHLQLTPAIVSEPIGYTAMDDGVALDTTAATSTSTETSADACATECNLAANCKGFNFDESASSCKLYNLVDTEATIGTAVGGLSSTITGLTLSLTSPGVASGLEAGQYVEGLDEYINGTIRITGSPTATNIPITFTEQAVKTIPSGTKIRIKSRTTPSSTVKAYSRDTTPGVNETVLYGYSAQFTISGLTGLPTSTTFSKTAESVANKLTVEDDLVLPVSFTPANSGNPVLTTAILPIVQGPQGCTSGLFIASDAQNTTACGCTSASVADIACRVPMSVKSSTTNSITVTRPIGSYFPYGVAYGSRLIVNAIEFTVTVTSGTPTNRIIGWTGSVQHVISSVTYNIPVTVKSFTASPATITFTCPSTSYGIINAQTITLSDSKGRTCRDIKACNASIQRLLDLSTTRAFSTKDIVACEGCNERVYRPSSSAASLTAAQISTIRKYMWFENEGVFACTGSPPAGTTFDGMCNPVCTVTDTNVANAVYDAATSACRVTCRNGFYWNGSGCATCPPVILPTNIGLQLASMCQATCVYNSGTTPSGMILTAVQGTDNTYIPNYTKACSVTCSTGAPNGNNTQCCPATTSALPAGTRIARYSDDCNTPVCETTDGDGANDFIASVTASGTGTNSTCTATCQSVQTQNSTTATRGTDMLRTQVYIPSIGGITSGSLNYYPMIATDLTNYFIFDNTSDANASKYLTNIGTYYFYPKGFQNALGNNGTTGTIGGSSYTTTSTNTTLRIVCPFKFKLTEFKIQSSVTQNITLRLNTLNKVINLTTGSLSTTPLSDDVYGKEIQIIVPSASAISNIRITGTVQQICTTVCAAPSGSASSGKVIFDEVNRVCKMVCNSGYTPYVSGCSSCSPVTLDPGTNVTLDASCGGSCTVFNPLTGDITTSMPGATAYSGTTTGSVSISSSASGTARACHIDTCSPTKTKYTTYPGSTTLNNSGCCPLPGVTTGSGITWSYPAAGSASTTVSTARCPLTCTAPTPSYGMTVTTTQPTSSITAACAATCPTYTNPSGFTIQVAANCKPTCQLTTADANADTPTTTYTSPGVATCTKVCKTEFSKDSGATDKCCTTRTAGPNTTIVYGSSSCNINPCTVTNSSSTNISGAQLSGSTCQVQCKNPTTISGATTSSYSTDGLCTLTCSTSVANATATTVDASGANPPSCGFQCNSGYYKPTSANLCCPNLGTSDTGTTATQHTGDCDFDCTTTVANASVLKDTVNRRCTLQCASGYIQHPGSGSSLCCQPGTFPDGGTCRNIGVASTRNKVSPASVSVTWCANPTGTGISEVWWNTLNSVLRPSIPALATPVYNQAGGLSYYNYSCPKGGTYVNGGLGYPQDHDVCPAGYEFDNANITTWGGWPNSGATTFCFLTSYLQWIRNNRTSYTCPATVNTTCSGTITSKTVTKEGGYCIARTTCPIVNLICHISPFIKFNLTLGGYGACASL